MVSESRCIYWLIRETVGIGLHLGTIQQGDRFSPKKFMKVSPLFPGKREGWQQMFSSTEIVSF
jgi:hypothetical protein